MSRPRFIRIDLSNVTSTLDLHSILRDSLGFPGWYGCNWDAFWDAITGLVQLPEKLQIVGWDSLSLRLPQDAELMQSCLLDLVSEHPELAPSLEFCR